MTGRLEGKVCLITGAASQPGLGSATALRFAQEGAVLYLTDVDENGLAEVVAAINQNGGKATGIRHDVTNEADWDDVFAQIRKQSGRLDVLVNNAGVAILSMVEAISTADWKKQLDINLNSVFYGTQRAVAEMRRVGEGGSIVNISSVCGLIGVIGTTSYSASKGGIRFMSKSIALETAAEGIRVNTVHPGMILTKIQAVAKRDNPAEFELLTASIPAGKMGEPLDVANMNLFLASDESRYCTGSEFTVDGGLVAK